MSLFGSLQLASNSMQAQQIGLQVVGQNMANANTPGYSVEQAILTPAPSSGKAISRWGWAFRSAPSFRKSTTS